MKYSILLLAGAAALLTSCGGDDGAIAPPVNNAPVFGAATLEASVPENTSSSLFTAAATDADGDAVSYSLTGPDSGLFSIDATGLVSFAEPPNYDLPRDADRDNVYQFAVEASDGRASASASASVTVTNEQEGVGHSVLLNAWSADLIVAPRVGTQDLLLVYSDSRMQFIDQEGTRTYLMRAITSGETGRVLAASAVSNRIYVLLAIEGVGTVVRYFGVGGDWGRVDAKVLTSEVDAEVAGAIFVANGTEFVALGDPGGSRAQDASSAFGKLYRISYDPFCGASLSSYCFNVGQVGRGIREPVGGGAFEGTAFLVDRGNSVDEISRFDSSATDFDFGWPNREGTSASDSATAAESNPPFLTYSRGTGFREGAGITDGAGYSGSIASLSGTILFGDKSGRILAVKGEFASDGETHSADEIEDRTEDFELGGPAIGEVRSVFTHRGVTYIVNSVGVIFRVD